MRLRLCAAGLLPLLSAVALAQTDTGCKEPVPPAIPDGRLAPAADMEAAFDEANLFILQSDLYQNCVNNDYLAEVDHLEAEKKQVDPSLDEARRAKIIANQSKKEALAAAYAAAVAAFKAANPSAAK